MDAVIIFCIGICLLYKRKVIEEEKIEIPIGHGAGGDANERAFMTYYNLLIKK